MKINDKELKITEGSFAEANALQKAMGRALKGNNIELPENMSKDLSDVEIAGMIDAALSVAISDDVENCIFECAKRCLIGTEKVTRDYFENVEHRKDYYPIMFAIAKANLEPFIGGLLSQFGGLGAKLGNTLK